MRIGLKEGQGFLAGYRPSFLFLPLILRTLESRLAKKKILESRNGPKDCTQFALSSGYKGLSRIRE
jgi:hypothetical protein